MICLHHTPRAPSSPICAGLWFPSLPQHLFFQLGVTSRAPFSPIPWPLSEVSLSLHSCDPSQRWSSERLFPLYLSMSVFLSYLSSQIQSEFLSGTSLPLPLEKNHTTWTLVPCKSIATDAGPPELLINPFTCLQLISSLFSLNLHPVGLKPSHVWTSQLEEQTISRLSNWSVYWIWIGFLPLEIKRLQTNKMNDPS